MVLTDVVLTLCIRRSLAEWVLRRDGRSAARAAADGAIDGFIVLGPTFVKLGQIMASSSGLFPEPLPSAARRFLDEVPPFGADEGRRMIAEARGRPPNQIFKDFHHTPPSRSEEHTSELPSLMRPSYAVFCVKKKKNNKT